MLRRFVLLLALAAAAIGGFEYATRIAPPDLPPPPVEAVRSDAAALRVGPAYLSRHGALWVMQVRGAPEELGYRHARLATPLMAEGDRRMLDLFSERVPSSVLRWAITRIVEARYRNLDSGFPTPRRAEIVSGANLARWAIALGLADVVRLGRGEALTGGRTRPSILASTLEAVLGAIHLEGGLAAVRTAVSRIRVLG